MQEINSDAIPKDIAGIIALFSKEIDGFGTHGSRVKVDDLNRYIVTFEDENWQSVFGTVRVSKGLHEWKLKILHHEEGFQSLVFGISTSEKYKDAHWHNTDIYTCFGYGVEHSHEWQFNPHKTPFHNCSEKIFKLDEVV